MLSTAVIIFREILEIAMILGVVLAATRGLADRGRWIGGGFAAGFLGAGLVAVFADVISNAASGMGQEFFNALVLFTASAFIGWTVIWMKSHAREMVAHFREVGQEVIAGKSPKISLSVVIGLAILREGSEIVLFIYGMILSHQSASSIIAGSTIGLVLGTIVGWMLYQGLIKISTKYMLKVTGWLLILLVAGLSSQGASYLSAAGYFEHLSTPLWNTSWLLSEDSIVGKALHSLIGYSARPSAIQLMFYGGTLLCILSIIAMMEKKQKAKALVIAVIVGSIAMVSPKPVLALDEIYSPNSEYREISLEYNGSRTFDRNPAKNNVQGNEFALEAGILPRVTVEMSGIFEKDADAPSRFVATELEGRFQFFDQGEAWVDSGLLVAYDQATHRGDANTLETKLLLEKDYGKISSVANIGFEQEVGVNATGGPDYVFLWNTRYRYNEYFQPGIELQNDLGQGAELSHFNEQQAYIGPAVWGRLFGHLKYQAAYCAGVSDDAAKSAARVLLEYETHF